MRIPTALTLVALCMGALSTPAQAQFFIKCRSASPSELKRNIHAHEEHMYRLQKKLITGFYYQGKLPSHLKHVGLAGVRKRLSELTDRKPAVLFYAYDGHSERLCVWLISATGADVSAAVRLGNVDMLRGLRPELIAALGVTTRSLPVPRSEMSKEAFERKMAAANQELEKLAAGNSLARLSETLLPDKIVEEIDREKIDTLIVMPVFDLGVVPFAALPISKGRNLIDAVSIVVAPGFFVFQEARLKAQRDFAGALVVGNPYAQDPGWHLAALPGAEAEAKQVAVLASVEPLIGPRATKSAILARLRKSPAPPLIFIAAHGIADDVNPLDGGFLVLSDGRWTGRDIVRRVPPGLGRPLVVLSACQTGLGKDFEVGTIGIARAWYEAGASNVVMSLWLVGDRSTQLLLTRFIEFARSAPPDKALRSAMLEARARDPRVAAWASFAVFGAPEQ